MAVSDGQRANAQTFNDAFLSRTQNSDTVAILGLNRPSGSGALIADAQAKINDNDDRITSNDNDIAQLFLEKEDLANKGVADGYAPLDSNTKIDPIYLPTELLSLKGNWDASTNTPTLIDGTGDPGDFYIVSVAGTQDLGSGSQTFALGDWCFYNDAGIWIKIINSNTVTSVNGLSGVVVLGLDDINDVDLTTVPPVIGQALVWDGTNWVPGESGGGSGVGGISYVKNPGGEIDAADHTAYQDAAQATPEDGDGGSPTTTVGRSTVATDILRGDASLVILKPASNVQGEGVHIGLDPIDPRDKFQRLKVSFDYKHPNPGGNPYIDGDYKVFVYDVDNAALIGAVENDDGGDILRHEGDGLTFTGFFNATDSLNYRLLIHITTTDTTSTAMAYDNVQLGPAGFVQVYPGSPLEDITVEANSSLLPSNTGAGLGSFDFYGTQRIGDNLRVVFRYQHGVAGSGTSGVFFPIPYGLNLNTIDAVVRLPSVFQTFGVDHNIAQSSGADQFMSAGSNIVNSNQIFMVRMGTGSTIQGQHFGASSIIEMDALIPIEEWRSFNNVVSNTELTQKTVRAEMHLNSDQTVLTSATADIEFDDTLFDTHGIFESANNRFVIPRAGFYQVNLGVNYASVTTDERVTVSIRQNGVGVAGQLTRSGPTDGPVSVDKIIFCEKGDLITATIDSTADTNYLVRGSESLTYMTISSLPDFTNYGVLNPNSEYKEILLDSRPQNSTANTYVSATEVLPLQAGKWEVGYHAPLRLNNNTAGILGIVGNVRLFNDTDSVALADTGASLYLRAEASQEIMSMVSNKTEITISEDKDITVQVGVSTSSATAFIEDTEFTGGITGNETSGKIWARRIG